MFKVVQKEIKLLCGAYPRFAYPKGHGIYSSHVNNILHEARTGQMEEKRVYELLRFPSFIEKVNEVFALFRCEKEDVRGWVREDFENTSKYKWTEEEEDFEGKSIDEKIDMIISGDWELGWWYTIGTEDDDAGRIEFETNMVSALANTIANVALSLYTAGEKKDEKFYTAITRFMKDVEEEYEVRWMKELKSFI
jgi:hypothetical protein